MPAASRPTIRIRHCCLPNRIGSSREIVAPPPRSVGAPALLFHLAVRPHHSCQQLLGVHVGGRSFGQRLAQLIVGYRLTAVRIEFTKDVARVRSESQFGRGGLKLGGGDFTRAIRVELPKGRAKCSRAMRRRSIGRGPFEELKRRGAGGTMQVSTRTTRRGCWLLSFFGRTEGFYAPH